MLWVQLAVQYTVSQDLQLRNNLSCNTHSDFDDNCFSYIMVLLCSHWEIIYIITPTIITPDKLGFYHNSW